MAKAPSTQHQHAGIAGRQRPTSDPPRFIQAPIHRGRPYQDFSEGPGTPPYRAKFFCSQDGALTAEAGDSTRHAMKQPNPFWTLETPMANFVGLYTNVPEGGRVQDDRRAWLVGELKHALAHHGRIHGCKGHSAFSAAG